MRNESTAWAFDNEWMPALNGKGIQNLICGRYVFVDYEELAGTLEQSKAAIDQHTAVALREPCRCSRCVLHHNPPYDKYLLSQTCAECGAKQKDNIYIRSVAEREQMEAIGKKVYCSAGCKGMDWRLDKIVGWGKQRFFGEIPNEWFRDE